MLVTLTVFSFFSLVFVVQMPTVAAHYGIGEKSTAYGVFYGTFALGALIGSLSVGTFLAGRDLPRLVRVGLLGFAVLLAALGLDTVAVTAYLIGFVLGFFYFMVVTSLSTVLQSRLDNNNRGRVMALWIMGFGGTVPLGVLVAGWVGNATSITAVLLAGSAWALVLAVWSDPRILRRKGAEDVAT